MRNTGQDGITKVRKNNRWREITLTGQKIDWETFSVAYSDDKIRRERSMQH